jgi:DNA anti-recombination protein RmuC
MSEERLDRLERIVETTLSLTQQFRQDLMQTNQMTKRNAEAIARLEERVSQFVEQSIADRSTFTAEIRGLRTEMQRLIERVLGDNQTP